MAEKKLRSKGIILGHYFIWKLLLVTSHHLA